MNCQYRVGGERNECLLNEGMRVNGRMHCEEWRSDDLGGDAAQTDLQSGCTEYEHLQCNNKRTASPYTHSGRIANPTERPFLGAVSVSEITHEKHT